MTNLNPEEKNLVDIAINLLTQLKVPFSALYVKEFLTEHKDFPTLLSIVALLDDFNIENIPVKLSISQLNQVEGPVVTCLNGEMGNKFIVIRKREEYDSITYFDSELGDVTESISDFQSKWLGISLLIESGEYSVSRGNTNYMLERRNKRVFKTISVVLLSILFTFFLVNSEFSVIFVVLSILLALGVTFSLLLLFKDIGLNTKLADSACTMWGISKNIGCDRVSYSKASGFWVFRMSEIGVFYFVGGFICLSFGALTGQGSILFLLFILSILALPYTFFSIYYQWRIAKQLCPLCTAVMIVLWAEFAVMYFSNISFDRLTSTSIGLAFFSFSIPVIFWLTFKIEIAQSGFLPHVKKKLNYLSSPELMKASIDASKIVFRGEVPETIKVNNGDFKIIVVLSLSCSPCMIAFNEIMDIASRYQNIQFNILLFTGDHSTIEKAKTFVKMKLKYGDSAAIDCLKNWYAKSTLNELDGDTEFEEVAEKIVKTWFSWTIQNGINHTPTIFLKNSLKPNFLGLYDFEPLFKYLKKTELMSA